MKKNVAVWCEISSGKHEHGGPGWEVGTCIWSPTTDRIGRSYSGYEVLHLPRCGDMVIHLYDRKILGASRISAECRIVTEPPPNPGPWEGRRGYYRIELDAFRAFALQVPVRTFREVYGDRIREDIETNQPEMYPFCVVQPNKIAVSQGRILNRCTPGLVRLVLEAADVDRKDLV